MKYRLKYRADVPRPNTFEERMVTYGFEWTFLFYLFGALYIVGPVIGWTLAAWTLCLWISGWVTGEDRVRIPLGVWVWAAAMAVMLLTLLVAHFDYSLGIAKTIKSSIGWAKGWALLAVFPLIGCLRLRPELIYRAASKVSVQALVLLPLMAIAARVGVPDVLYVSPLKVVGGPGPEFFALRLYSLEPGNELRYWLFTPWAPALGFIANVYFVLVLRDPDLRWRIAGSIGALAMIFASGSRLGLVALVVVQGMSWALIGLFQPIKWLLGGISTLIFGVLFTFLQNFAADFMHKFHAARADSSRVRAALGRIAMRRWQEEAPVWGHGIVERGPHLVEYMPIGSHHTWYGVLFVKGAVGFYALLFAMAWSFLDLLIKAQWNREAQAGFGVVLVLFMYSFGENLEILSYLFWPGLVVMGLGFNAGFRGSQHGPAIPRPRTEGDPATCSA